MLSKLLKLSLVMSITRMIAITMPVTDVLVLTHLAPDSLAGFALGAQWAQLGVVACGSLGAAVAIVVPRCVAGRRATWLAPAMSCSVFAGLGLTIALLGLSAVPSPAPESSRVTATLSFGMIPLCVYAVLSSYSQCVGDAQRMLALTVFAGILNGVLDVVLVHSTMPAIGVAVATTVCWTMLCLVLVLLIRRNTSLLRWSLIKRAGLTGIRLNLGLKGAALLRIASHDFVSKVGFVLGIAGGFWLLSLVLPVSETSILAAMLSYMNIVSVLLGALTTAFGIVFLSSSDAPDGRRFACYALIALIGVHGIFLVLEQYTAHMYSTDTTPLHSAMVRLATAVVLFDGAALFAVTWLRMQKISRAAPYMRLLMFPCAAAWLILASETTSQNVICAMVVGNALVALILFIWCAGRK